MSPTTGYTKQGSDDRFGRWMVALDSFSGATDDIKMSAAKAYTGSQTYPPYIGLTNQRQHTFTSPWGQPHDGFGVVGGARGWSNVEKGNKYKKTPVAFNIGANSVFDMASGDSWNWHLEGIQFTGSSTATLVTGSGGGTLWASTFRNCTGQGMKGCFGNSGSKLLVDLITVDGQWELLNFTDQYVNVGGGDVRGFFADGGNFGCGSQAPPSTGTFQMKFGGYNKGYIGPIYVTADNGWRGVDIAGSQSSSYGLDMYYPIIEGRNNGVPCDGNLLRIVGGSVNIFGGCINTGMANPLGSEHAMVDVSGTAEVSFFGTTFSHHSSRSSSSPVIYVSGSAGVTAVGAHGLKRGSRSGNASWGANRPTVQQTVSGLVLASDSFCTVI